MLRQLPLILLLNIVGLALFFSWYLPANHGFWCLLDTELFYFFYKKLINSRIFMLLVATTNNRAFDGISLIAMGYLMLLFCPKKDIKKRQRTIGIGLVILLTAEVINQLAQNIMPVKRISPSLSFPGLYRVSDMLHFSTKDASHDSFPGDHGTVLLTFLAFIFRYFTKKVFAIALIIVTIFALPRIIIGAHWLTDITVGSLSVALIGVPWVLMTPLSDYLVMLFTRYLTIIHSKIK